MTDFFISDTHFFHDNIIKFAKRPFVDSYHMNEEMVKRWNAKVGKHDRVFHLGDFGFGKGVEQSQLEGIFERLNGEKNLLIGNHDHSAVKALKWNRVIEHRFTYKDWRGGKHIVCDHFPLFDWDRRFHGTLHFYGHVHNNEEVYNPQKNSYNLCVELRDYEPKTVDEIVKG